MCASVYVCGGGRNNIPLSLIEFEFDAGMSYAARLG